MGADTPQNAPIRNFATLATRAVDPPHALTLSRGGRKNGQKFLLHTASAVKGAVEYQGPTAEAVFVEIALAFFGAVSAEQL